MNHSALVIQPAADAVFIRAIRGEKNWTYELTLLEAKLLQRHLDAAIGLIESGNSVRETLEGLIETLPVAVN